MATPASRQRRDDRRTSSTVNDLPRLRSMAGEPESVPSSTASQPARTIRSRSRGSRCPGLTKADQESRRSSAIIASQSSRAADSGKLKMSSQNST